MPDVYLSALCLPLTVTLLGSIIIPIWQLRALRYKEVEQLSRSYNSSEVEMRLKPRGSDCQADNLTT